MDEKNLVPKRRFRGCNGKWILRNFKDIASYRHGKAHEQNVVENGKYVIVNSKFISTNGKTQKYSNLQIEPLLKGEITFVLSDIPNGRALARTYLIKQNNLFTLNQRILGITPKENTNSYYLKEQMNRHRYFLTFDDGANQTNLSNRDLYNYRICCPDVKEQQKIGEFFKILDERIVNQERKIAKVKALKSAYLTEMFPQEDEMEPKRRFKGFFEPWKKIKLEELAEIKTGYAFSSNQFNANGEYLVITNKNIQDQDKGIISSGDRINIYDINIIKNYKLDNNNVLVTMDGVNIGKTGRFTDENAVLAQRVGRLKSNQIEFVYQVTNIKNFILEMNRLSVGNAIKHISLKQIAEYSFYAPTSKKEQQKIGAFLKNLDDQIATEEAKLEKLKKTKEAYLEEMFV